MTSILAQKYKNKSATIENTSVDEIRALFGILIISATKNDNHLSAEEIVEFNCRFEILSSCYD